MPGVLNGIRVAAFTHFAAGPLTAQFLGALGADVIKIEAPFGDFNRQGIRDQDGRFGGLSPYFVTLNRNQRAISLDLKSQSGMEAARRLIRSSDVMIENFKPGALDKLGLGYPGVRDIRDDLVYCSISAYDREGPKANELGQDLLIQALSGFASLNGFAGMPPMPTGSYPIDAYVSFCCVIGILAALRHRDATGQGQWVRVDMMSAALHLIAQEASYAMNVDPVRERSAANVVHPDQAAPYGVYEAVDGQAFVMSITAPETLAKLAEKLGILEEIAPYLTTRGIKNDRDRVSEALARALKKLNRDDALALCKSLGIWAAPIRSIVEALDDPAVVARGIVRDVDSPYAGKHRVVVEPLHMSETPIEFSRPAPALGAHSREVLSELGYSEAEIDAMAAEGAVKIADS